MNDSRTLIAPGELHIDLLSIFYKHPEALTVLLSAPGYFNLTFDGATALFEQPDQRISRRTSFAFRQALLDNFSRQIDRLPQSIQWEHIIQSWIDLIDKKGASFFLREDLPLFTRLISNPRNSIVFSGPITEQRLKQQTDLTFQLAGESHIQTRKWFTDQVAASTDISNDVRTTLLDSWAGSSITPEDAYYKVLTEYFWQTIQGLDVETDTNPMLKYLTQFQVDAYEHAKGILRQFGGVFLADVVGLGKTYIGLALLKFLQIYYNEHAVIVAPPNVCPQWKALAAEHRIELQTVSHGKLSDLENYKDREILVIDESHNFRNAGTARYEEITQWLERDGAKSTKVILLSATPQNNRPEDVANQLRLFPDKFMRLPFPENSLDTWLKQVNAQKAVMSDLLQHVVVRRTRHFIQMEYPDAKIRMRDSSGEFQEMPLVFPTRVSDESQCLRYNINSAYGEEMYDQILNVLQDMHYSIYGLSIYVLSPHKNRKELAGINRSGRNLRGLFKVLMFKRLESSIEAFRISLKNFEEKLENALLHLQNNEVQIRTGDYNSSEDDLSIYSQGHTLVPSNWFDVRPLKAHIDTDLDSVRKLRKIMEKIRPEHDTKLIRLRDYMKDRPPREHRTLIFTQFADTAKYLSMQLGQEFGQTAVATADSGNLIKLAQRFAPRANHKEGEIPESEQINLLISTDVLSEGVNLQDADTLINYDLHWNPVRLIQRAGRIDRIGSTHDKIYIASFLPEKGLEANLKLEDVLRRRIQDFRSVFGEDSEVLPSEDKALFSDDAIQSIYSAYSGEALKKVDEQDTDDSIDGLSRHSDRLLKLRRDNRERYNEILKLRPGRRAYSNASEPTVVATKMDWYWSFWIPGMKDASPVKIPNSEGLERLYIHAKNKQLTPIASPIPEMINAELSAFITTAYNAFQHETEQVRDKRMHPELNTTDRFLIDTLERYKKQALATEHPLIDSILDWLRAATAQQHLRKLCRKWTKDTHPPKIVFHELRSLFNRYPPPKESSGAPMVIASIAGGAMQKL